LTKVLFPTLGLPTTATNPDLNADAGPGIRGWELAVRESESGILDFRWILEGGFSIGVSARSSLKAEGSGLGVRNSQSGILD
jgi:hypothetical protein